MRTFRLFIIVFAVGLFASCNSIDEPANDKEGNFEALWSFVDRHYCFFDQKNIDWNAIGDSYRARLGACKNAQDLFRLMSAMLDELQDGHVNLSSWFATSYYRKWWSDYPQNYNERIVLENYLNFNYRTVGSIDYGMVNETNVGYMRYPTFAAGIGQSNLDAIFDYLSLCSGLIIDVRDNGGGDLTNVEKLVSRFISEPITAGYIIHKTGTGHDDFSKPYAYTYSPADGYLRWAKPVVILTNRSTFSAANNFVAIMKTLPGVTIVGDVTGGGSGMPISSELPIGWGIRISACRILDPNGQDTEWGVAPTEGCRVNITDADIAAGRDPILDRAVALLTE